jgi:hypothetical protein
MRNSQSDIICCHCSWWYVVVNYSIRVAMTFRLNVARDKSQVSDWLSVYFRRVLPSAKGWLKIEEGCNVRRGGQQGGRTEKAAAVAAEGKISRREKKPLTDALTHTHTHGLVNTQPTQWSEPSDISRPLRPLSSFFFFFRLLVNIYINWALHRFCRL